MLSVIRQARLAKGLTQMEVVEKCGGVLNQYRLSIIERGLVPRPDEAVVLCLVLGLSPAIAWPGIVCKEVKRIPFPAQRMEG